jgi:hypothetical protein
MEKNMKVYAKTIENFTALIAAFVKEGLTFEASKTDGDQWLIEFKGGF